MKSSSNKRLTLSMKCNLWENGIAIRADGHPLRRSRMTQLGVFPPQLHNTRLADDGANG